MNSVQKRMFAETLVNFYLLTRLILIDERKDNSPLICSNKITKCDKIIGCSKMYSVDCTEFTADRGEERIKREGRTCLNPQFFIINPNDQYENGRIL